MDSHEDGALPGTMSAKLKPQRGLGPGGRRLAASYSDLDGDGRDDLTLRGVAQIGWEDRVVREEPCVLRFL